MISELDIIATLRNGSTYLQHAFYTRPFKVANIREDKSDPLLPLVIMTASPGMLEGDVYQWKIRVNENAQLQLQTQSYQRLFSMEQGARQEVTVEVGPGAAFHYLPHPTVPQAKSVFKGHNIIRLQHHSRLLWSEIITCGRKLSGEIFAFTRYQSLTEVYWKDKLVLKDNCWLEPAQWPLSGIGQLETYTHQASLFCFDEQADMTALCDAVHELFSEEQRVAVGVSRTITHGLMLRILGDGGEQLKDMITRAATLLTQARCPQKIST